VKYCILILTGFLLIGCGNGQNTGSLQSRIKAWAKATSFGSTVGKLDNDIAYVKLALDHKDPASARTFCLVLADDVQPLYTSDLPTPDESLTQDISKAYKNLYNGTYACYNDSKSGSMQKLAFDYKLLLEGEVELGQSQKLIAQLSSS
jgi:hypothetical protein